MSKKKIMLDALQQRYPEIAFALQFTPFKEEKSCLGTLNILSSLEETEVLYVFGIGPYFAQLQSWLTGRKGRLLIVLEDELGKIDHFLQTADAKSFLECPNIHLKYVTDWEDALEELPLLYPTDRVHVCPYKKGRAPFFKKIQLQIYRNSASFSAILSEVLYAHKLFANVYPNLLKLPDCFFANRFKGGFKGIPAVICGAGPSLEKALSELKKMEDKALIIAGGSAITALAHHQITPHLCMALDPNQEEYQRLYPSSTFEIPFLYGSRLHKDVFGTCNGPFGYMKSDTGGMAEEWFEKKLKIEGEAIGPSLGREAFSVTTLAVAFACEMGCSPIILAGVDLAFTGMQRYANGVLENNHVDQKELDQVIVRKDRQGKKVHTLLKWVMESDAISNFAREHSKVKFMNATEGGIGFASIPYIPLDKARQKYCTHSLDLRGKIHAQLQKSSFASDLKGHLQTASRELTASLERSLRILQKMSQELQKQGKEGGKMVVLQMDLEEESAFEFFLQPLECAFKRLFARYSFDSPLEATCARLSQMELMVQSFLQTLNTQRAYCAKCAE